MQKSLTIQDRLKADGFKNEISNALPSHVKPEQFIRAALTQIIDNPDLAKCSQVSFFKAIMKCGQFGIIPDGRLVYLIPYGTDCQLIIGYLGMIELTKRNGNVGSIYSAVVRANDDFRIELGLSRNLIHIPKRGSEAERGKITGAYAIIKFRDEEFDFEFMERDEVDSIQQRSKARSGPWKTDHSEMVKKTVLRRLLKRQSLSPELREAEALENDQFQSQNSRYDPASQAKAIAENQFPSLPESSTPAFEEIEEDVPFDYSEEVNEVMK